MSIGRSILWLAGAVGGLFLGGCSDRAPSAPTEAASTPGGPRLAVLSPALADTIRDLGAENAIVGRHGWDAFTAQTVPAVGSESGLDYESLLRVRPTCVLLQEGAKGVPPRLSELADANRWRVATVPLLRLEDVRTSIGALASLAGASAEASDALSGRFDAAMAAVPGFRERAGRVLVLISTDPPAAAGPGSFHHEILSRLGATPIPNDGTAFQQLSIEGVMRLDPDSIIVLAPGGNDRPESLGKLREVGLRAVRDRRVLVVTDARAHLPSTGLVRVAEVIRAGVMAWPPANPVPSTPAPGSPE